MKFDITLIFSFLFITTFSHSYAADQLGDEYKNMEEMMGSIRLEKKQVVSMLDLMVTSGRITLEEGQKAKREIANMKDGDLDNLKTSAIAEVKNKQLLGH